MGNTGSSLQLEDLTEKLDDMLSQLAILTERIGSLEIMAAEPAARAAVGNEPATPAKAAAPAPDAIAPGISEQEVLAVSAAIAAWLGVHAHIRQIRLIRTGAWAQQGRVTIQTSHRLNY